jgi:MFS transporter, DHA2 family, multidrug resistance protein
VQKIASEAASLNLIHYETDRSQISSNFGFCMAATATVAPPAPLRLTVARPAINPWVIALTVTLATFMELLDTSIANVSLPYIAGGLGRSYDEVTWILTTYLVANAVVLPMSAWLSRVLGAKTIT